MAEIEEGGAVADLAAFSIQTATVEVEPSTHPVSTVAETKMDRLFPPAEIPTATGQSRKSSHESVRPSSAGSSGGMMVEERDLSDREGDDAGLVRTIRRSIDNVVDVRQE